MARVRVIVTLECDDDRAGDLKQALENYDFNGIFAEECLPHIEEYVQDHEANEEHEDLDFELVECLVDVGSLPEMDSDVIIALE